MEDLQLINFDRFPLLTLSLLFYHYCSCCNLFVYLMVTQIVRNFVRGVYQVTEVCLF